MSRPSYVTSLLTGSSPEGWPVLWLSVLMIPDGLRESRFAQRKQRLLLQLHGEKPQPDSAQRQNCANVPKCWKRVGSKFRTRQPEKIQAAHRNQPHCNLWQHGLVALYVARQQRKKRNEKV